MINIPPIVRELIDGGALVILNDSGGKDSQAMRIAVRELVPAEQLAVIHATLGQAEWPGALEHARDGAKRDGLPFHVAKAPRSFFEMVERRHQMRPDAPCWPSAAYRQCTSDLKRDPIARVIRQLAAARGTNRIVNCAGIRADESNGRAKLEPVKRSKRFSTSGRDWWEWLPIHHYTRRQVFDAIADAGETPHPAYAAGNERLSCMFCIMGSRNDLRNAAKHNPELYRRYVELERRTGYTMHQSQIPLTVLTGIN